MKRILIISHNCLSKTGSNGRTLSNYFIGYEKGKLAQLYIHPEKPDFSVCQNFFCISDSDVLHSIIKRHQGGQIVREDMGEKPVVHTQKAKKNEKNSFVFLLREFAWNSGLWKTDDLKAWINEFQPELILFQAGDAGFLFKLTVKIAKKFDIPIILYNTEGYYFKTESYLQENAFTKLLYPMLHRYFCREYRNLMKYTKLSIYNCDMLMHDYQKEFSHNGIVIMNTSEFADISIPKHSVESQIVYAGSVGVGRYESIIAVAEAAHKIDENLYVCVYTSIDDIEIQKKMEKCKGIRLKGYISYKELQNILLKSKYLLSVENFAPFYCEDLKYAFSTKIADSLASGNCLIVYAPETIAVSQYLENRQAAVLITCPDELESALRQVLKDDNLRSKIAENGRKLALENHSLKKNRDLFQSSIRKAIANENITG